MNTGFVRPAVATVLTACGIETNDEEFVPRMLQQLQQYLPLAVLKRAYKPALLVLNAFGLQQYLPLAVLKLILLIDSTIFLGCNSTYRLRY